MRLAVLAQEVTKLAHVLLEPAIGHEAAVAGQDFRLRQVGGRPVLVRVAEDELTRLERGARAGRRYVARALDHRLRKPVAITEVIVRVIEGRGRLEIERREHLDAFALGEELVVLGHATLALGGIAGEQDRNGVKVRAREVVDPVSGSLAPVSPSISARATMPCLNSSGNVASDASSTPSARRPFQVKATVTQRLLLFDGLRMVFARTDCTLFKNVADSHARPPAASAKREKLVAAGQRRGAGQQDVLDVVELKHSMAARGHCIWSSMFENDAFSLQRFLDLVGAHERIFAVFEETRALVLAHELDEGRRVRLPVFGKPSRFSKTVLMPVAPKSATASSVYLSKSVSKMP